MKKRVLALLMIICVFTTMFVGCKKEEEVKDDGVIDIACMKGPTGVGMIKLISDADEGKTTNEYRYNIAGTADEITAKLISGDLDVAAVPCNVASVLCNKTNGEIVTVAINTLGVLYMIENGETISSVQDLKGRTIYSTGQGTTPEYTLRYLLESAGIDPDTEVDIQYKSQAEEVLATLALDPEAILMLPQPYVTAAVMNGPGYRIALDVTEEWEKVCEDSTIVTGVLVAKKSFIEANKDKFEDFLEEYKASTEYVNSNVDEAAELLGKYEIIPQVNVAKEAIPYCNVTYIDGEEMQEKVLAYIKVLCDQNPSSVGGKVNEGMFYEE